jgi:integrase
LIGRELKAVIDRLNPEVASDARTAAMLLLGYAAGLRSAELVGLDWQRAGGRAYGGTGFVSVEPEGLEVTLLTSKASQLAPVQLAIPDREMPTLRTWIDRWIAHAQVRPGAPLFRPINRHKTIQPNRLASPSVANIVKACMLKHAQQTGMPEAEALLLAGQFSSHSMRRGYCTTAANARVPLSQIRPRSRHRSDEVLGRYIASAEQGWNHSGLEGVGF